MKYFSCILFCFFSFSAFSQKKDFTVLNLSLPPEISYYDNQFSGLYIHKDNLYLMSESRLQDSAEAKLYAIKLSDIEHKMIDSAFILPFRRYNIYNLELLRSKMSVKGDEYEGLEAIVIEGTQVYFSVETTTPSDNCYLLKGNINDTAVILNTDFLTLMPKPVLRDGKHVYNAGFEAISLMQQNIMAFFEFNYFPSHNDVSLINQGSYKINPNHKSRPIDKLPFRITDITKTGKNKFTAINFFYKGGGADTVYRVPKSDIINDHLIRGITGYHSYCRLIKIKKSGNNFTWKSLWEFPTVFSDHNWEGIAAYKEGYFIINDKYTAARPYSSVLLYLKEK